MIDLKTVLLNVLLVLSLNLSAQDVDCSMIIDIDGRYYIDGEENLFTGTCVSCYGNGVVSYRATYFDGEICGLCQWWHHNGQKKKEITYVLFEGKSLAEGYSYEWYRNGQLRVKERFKKGLRDGKWCKYDPDGKLIKRGVYENGKHVSGDKIEEPKTSNR